MTAPAKPRNGKVPQPQPMVEIGATGLRIFAGRIDEEFDKVLRDPRRRYKLYQEMADNDPTIGAGLRAMTLLARQVEWRFEHENDEDPRVEFLMRAKDSLAHPWEDLVSEALWNMFVNGWAFHEIVYAQLPTGEIGWSKFAPRGADSLERWIYDDGGRKLLGMEQRPAPTYELLQIPLTKALLFRTESLKDSPEGKSILRSCYRPWYFKKRIENIEGIGIERDLAGLPVIMAPARLFDPSASAGETQVLDYLKEMVVNIRRDEQEGVVLPQSYDPDTKMPLFELKLLSSAGERQFNTNEIISRYDLRILQTMMADFLQVGHEKVGSFALASSKTNLFAVSLGTYLDQLAAQFNRKAIPDLLALNGMDLEDPPVLVHGDIESQDMAEYGAFLGALSAAGFPLFPDMSLENKLRGMMGLEPLSQHEWQERETEREAQAQLEMERAQQALIGGPPADEDDTPAEEPVEKRAEPMQFAFTLPEPRPAQVEVHTAAPVVHVQHAAPAPITVNVPAPAPPHITVEAAKAADIHVDVQPSPAPNVQIDVAPQPPVVQVTTPEPRVDVHLPAPNVHVDVAAAPAPVVNVTTPEPKVDVHVAAAPAPNVQVDVAAPTVEVAAPVVHIAAPSVTVEKQDAPVVTVDTQPIADAITAAAEKLKRPDSIRIIRDADGQADRLEPE